jgi:hypothetical protein
LIPFPIAADIELSSVGSEGKIYIISKTRKHYLCFNKKGQLVTKVSTRNHLSTNILFPKRILIMSALQQSMEMTIKICQILDVIVNFFSWGLEKRQKNVSVGYFSRDLFFFVFFFQTGTRQLLRRIVVKTTSRVNRVYDPTLG